MVTKEFCFVNGQHLSKLKQNYNGTLLRIQCKFCALVKDTVNLVFTSKFSFKNNMCIGDGLMYVTTWHHRTAESKVYQNSGKKCPLARPVTMQNFVAT